MDGASPSMTRSRGRSVLSVVFALLALNAGLQVILSAVGRSDDPPPLRMLQSLVTVVAAGAAIGGWKVARWAPAAALLHGALAAGMIVSLGPMLDLDAAERDGLWYGGAAILGFGLWAAWYFRRDRARAELIAAASTPR